MGMPSAQQITSIVGLPSQPPPPGNCTFTQMGNFVHGLTTQFATAVQPIADAQAEVARKKQDAQQNEGCDDFHVAKILGYSNVYDERDITPIWRKFQATRSDWKGNRDYLKDRMLAWSTATGNAINMVPPGKVTMKDITSVECAPEDATGHYEFLER